VPRKPEMNWDCGAL